MLATATMTSACSDATPTSPETPIPAFAVAQCAEWSCAIEDCPNDPAIYGACCIQAADASHPATEKPSCQAPPGGGGGGGWEDCSTINAWYCTSVPPDMIHECQSCTYCGWTCGGV